MYSCRHFVEPVSRLADAVTIQEVRTQNRCLKYRTLREPFPRCMQVTAGRPADNLLEALQHLRTIYLLSSFLCIKQQSPLRLTNTTVS